MAGNGLNLSSGGLMAILPLSDKQSRRGFKTLIILATLSLITMAGCGLRPAFAYTDAEIARAIWLS